MAGTGCIRQRMKWGQCKARSELPLALRSSGGMSTRRRRSQPAPGSRRPSRTAVMTAWVRLPASSL